MSVYDCRNALEMTQAELASLLGVHPMTVSKWERGEATPTPYVTALLGAFRRATNQEDEIGRRIAETMAQSGPAVALHCALHAAYGPRDA